MKAFFRSLLCRIGLLDRRRKGAVLVDVPEPGLRQRVYEALNDLGAGLSDVVRTRMFITDFTCFDQIADAHRELFSEHPPGATMVEVAALVHDDMIIEIEVEAVC